MNKKNGNIKSVGVKPCHVACSNGGYTEFHVPGVFTKIINAMVKPLKISTDSILEFILFQSVVALIFPQVLINKYPDTIAVIVVLIANVFSP